MSDATTTARIRLALEGASAVEQGLSKVQAKVSDVGKTMLGLAGGISAAGLTAWIKGAVDAADETSKMAQKTGLLTKEVAGLQLAFDQSGAGDKMQATLARLAKEASNGNDAFKAMGVTVSGADGKLKTTRELLGEVADKFSGYRDGSEKTALAMELFGKTGADIIPVLNGGSAALAEFDDMAQRLGLTISEETAAQAEQFNDTLDLIGQSSQGVARQVAAQLLPTLTTLTQELFNNITQGDNLKKTADFLAGGLKGLYSVGVGVVEVFKTVGVALGGTGAAIAAIMSGEFGQAKEIVNQMRADISASWASAGASIKRVWDGAGSSTVSALAASSRAARENAPAVAAAAKASKAKASADKDAAKAAKELADTMAKVSALSDKLSEQYVKDADAVMEGNQSLREEIELIGLTTSQRAALLEAKEAEIIASKQLELISLKNADADAVTLSNLEREIALRQQRIGLLSQKTAAEGAAALAESDKKAFEDSAKAQAEAYADMWKSVDDTAHDVFVSVANEGEDAFKRIGKTLKAAVLDMLYQMTVKKWIFQISGQSTGSMGSTGSLLDSASSAYSAYTMAAGGGAGTAGAAGSMSAIGSYAGGSMSAANAYGSIYANVTGTGLDGLLATNGAYGTASGAAAGSSSSWLASVGGYAALIAVAIAVANNLYEKGYNRQAVGHGDAQTVRFGRSSYTTDPNISRTAQYEYSFERYKTQHLEMLGLNDKWVDILSGTTRMAALFGRKLSEVGYQGNFEGGNVSVSGYAKYKGGLFRSNKTVSADVDPQAAAQVESLMRSIQAGSKSMAAAMGLNAAAIDNYTGKLKVNMKGADTAAEQSERMAKAMDNLQYSMLKAASGGKLAKEEFTRMSTQAKADMEAVGISASGMADIIAQGMMGRMSQSQVGEALSEMVIGGIYNMVVSPFASSIAQAFMATIIQPMVMAVTTGGSISTAVSQASIQSVVASANAAAAQLSAILADPGFRAAMAGVQQAIGGIASASVKPAANIRAYGSAVSASGAAANAAASQVKSAWRSISDSIIDEIRRIRGEILGTSAAGEAYNLARFTTATAAARAGSRSAAEMLPELGRSVLEMAQETASSRSDLNAMRGQILESLELTNALIAKKYKFSVPAFADGGYHAGGLRLVGERGPEIEATGPARYWDASRTQEMMGAGNNAALIAEIRALRSEVASLRSEAKRSADADALTADNIDGLVRQKYKLKTVAA